jgi:hypothetical protein
MAPKRGSSENLPEFGIYKTHLVDLSTIFTKQVKPVSRKNHKAHRKRLKPRSIAAMAAAITIPA